MRGSIFMKRGLVGAAALFALPRTFPVALCDDGGVRKKNKVLGDESLPPSKRRHRVGLAAWSHTGMEEKKRPASLSALFDHALNAGYDGLEASLGDLRDGGYVPKGISDEELTKLVREEEKRTGIKLLGALYLILDGNEPIRDWDLDMRDSKFKEKLRKQI